MRECLPGGRAARTRLQGAIRQIGPLLGGGGWERVLAAMAVLGLDLAVCVQVGARDTRDIYIIYIYTYTRIDCRESRCWKKTEVSHHQATRLEVCTVYPDTLQGSI